MNNTSNTNSASRVVVAAHSASSVDLPRGAAIQGVGGRLWLTQEGDQRDHVLAAGTIFCTDRGGRVVLSAIDGDAVALVRETAPRHCVPGAVTIDSIQRIKREAELAQAKYVAGLFVRLAEWLAGLARGAVRPERSGSEVEGRLPEKFRGYMRSH